MKRLFFWSIIILFLLGCGHQIRFFPEPDKPEPKEKQKKEAKIQIEKIEERLYVIAVNFLNPGEKLLSVKWRITAQKIIDLNESFSKPEVGILKNKVIVISIHQLSEIDIARKYECIEVELVYNIKKNDGSIRKDCLQASYPADINYLVYHSVFSFFKIKKGVLETPFIYFAFELSYLKFPKRLIF